MPNVKFVQETSTKIKNSLKVNNVKYLFGSIMVFIKDALPEKVNLDSVLARIEKTIPSQLTQEVDEIFIGHFSDFYKRDVNAIYRDGAIFVTNRQSSDDDLYDDIAHEIAHAVENQLSEVLYRDQELETEFLGKRKRLFSLLQQALGDKLPIDSMKEHFFSTEYSLEFDKFLYKTIGYRTLQGVSPNLFPSPYSITSLGEYFAVGFEFYYIKNKAHQLRQNCPTLFKKLDTIDNMCQNYSERTK
jgi:hypothetical protein